MPKIDWTKEINKSKDDFSKIKKINKQNKNDKFKSYKTFYRD